LIETKSRSEVLMTRSITLIFIVFSFASTATSQVLAKWTQMSKADIERTLNFSAWGHTQTDTDTSEMFYSPTRPGTPAIGQSSASRSTTNTQQQINNNRADQGATNQAISVNYHIRLLSARPIREAISRVVMLENAQPAEDIAALMQPFVDRDFGQYIVVSVVFDSTDGRYSGPALQAFGSATADTLKNKTYLERKDGKRLYLMDYRAPQADGLGAKFVFERAPDGKPFIRADSGNFRFYSEVSDKIKLNVKYNVADLMYNGRLEY
jgi:hypothetical protein